MKSEEAFLEVVPADAAVYWHSDSGRGADDAWLWAMSRATLSHEAADQTNFLEEFLAPETSEMGFVILPDFADFVFFGRVDAPKFNLLRSKLEEQNYHYIFEDGNRAIISSTRSGLGEAVAVLSQEKSSMADQKMKLMSFNRARRRSSAQIYFGENFKIDDFRAMSWNSDFWSSNKLTIAAKRGAEVGLDVADFDFLAVSDDEYLKENMEKILKDDLAVLLPEIREKILPDKTVVKELLANPDAFLFEDKKIGVFLVHYLFVSAINQEFLVGEERQKVIISNSTGMFENFLADSVRRPDYYGKNLIELILGGLKWLTADFNGVIFEINVDNL
ncbi:hypothetical protein HZB93_03610 [Candidatus Falkowbacteria bacterium]|nr:hypothetical protein [Candidatus Falkowbacteria bacterium]